MKNNITNKIVMLALIVCIMLGTSVPAFAISTEKIDLSSTAAVVIDINSNSILYDDNMNKQLPPASTTKLVTALVVLDHLKLEEVITVPNIEISPYASQIFLQEGEQMTVEELLNGALISSGNDACIALAIAVSGSEAEFAKLMNEKAKEVGAVNSNFMNASGMSEPNHLSTAYDLALITKAAMENEVIYDIASKPTYTIPATNLYGERELTNSNKLISGESDETVEVNGVERPVKYDYAIGGKTGYETDAGYCLANLSVKDGTEIISVTLGAYSSYDRAVDQIKLIDLIFDKYRTIKVVEAGEKIEDVEVIKGSDPKIDGTTEDGLYITLPREAADSIVRYEAEVFEDISAPIKKGDQVGIIHTFAGQEEMGTTPLIASKDVEEGGPWTLLGVSDTAFVVIVILAIVIVIGLALWRRHIIKLKKIKKAEARKRREALIEAEVERRRKFEEELGSRDWHRKK